ncbi:MAG: DUF1573 domain-containing protein [Desulfobacterales bacterium]
MKMKRFCMVIFLILAAGTLCFGAGEEAKTPLAFVAQAVHEFEPVLDGDEVIHSFAVQNRGNAELRIERVQTSCGCTTASYTNQIPAGGEGKVEIKVNTAGYGGRKLSKNITVFTNDPDPARRQIGLTIQGNVKKFVTISPNRVRMTGQVGNEIKSKVSIVPQPEYPFRILEVKTEKPDNIRVELETLQKEAAMQYLLTVVNLKQSRIRYADNIILKTDSSVRPEIKINVYGDIF